MEMPGGSSPHRPTNTSSNPGYGNDTNVGFSPGNLGGIPAGFTKFDFQRRLFMRTYGDGIVAQAFSTPVSIAVILTFPMFLCAAISLWLADLVTAIAVGVMADYSVVGMAVAAVIAFVAWLVAIVFSLYITVGLWVMSLVQHRRLNGPLSPWLGWTKKFDEL